MISSRKIKPPHPLQWVLDSFTERADYLQKSMFGCQAGYLAGCLVLVIADGDEPWNGLMIATHKEHHASLCQEFKELSSHPILGKWLYLSQQNIHFETYASDLCQLILNHDPRIGVEPKPKKTKKPNIGPQATHSKLAKGKEFKKSAPRSSGRETKK